MPRIPGVHPAKEDEGRIKRGRSAARRLERPSVCWNAAHPQSSIMNAFTTGHRNQPWVWQVTGLCFVLGLLLAASLQTVRSISRSGAATGRVGVPPPLSPVRADMMREKDKEIASLRQHNTDLGN